VNTFDKFLLKVHCWLVLACLVPTWTDAQVRASKEPDARIALARADSMMQEQMQQTRKQLNIIVEFKDEPLFVALKATPAFKPTAQLNSYQLRFSQFAADVEALRIPLRAREPRDVRIRHQYYRTFFGVSMAVSLRNDATDPFPPVCEGDTL
jgi:hypothetical protein